MHGTGSNDRMEGRAFIDFLHMLEDRIRPETCTFPDFNYWPILRFAVNYKRKMGASYLQLDLPEVTAPNHTGFRPFEHLHTWYFGLSRKELLNRRNIGSLYPVDHFADLTPADALFYNRANQYAQIQDGVFAHPLTDGMRQITHGMGWHCVTYANAQPRIERAAFLVEPGVLPALKHPSPVLLTKPRDAAEHARRVSIIAKVAELNQLISQTGTGLEIDPGEVLYRIQQTSRYMHYWLLVLCRIRPRVIFLSSFSGAHYICAAATKLGITVVDIQHGGMNPYHPVAANWSHVPRKGYELLPDIFWCWNARSAEYIQFPKRTRHRAVIGGNPKAALEIMEQAVLEPVADIPTTVSGKRRILVALQYGAEDLLMPHLKRVYLARKTDFDWQFRLHPTGWDRIDEAVRELGLDRDRLAADSLEPLPVQLAQVDLVLTNASTIVFEAVDYGADAVVCSSMGAALYDEMIQAGTIGYAGTKDALERVLDGLARCPGKPADRRAAVAEIARRNNASIRDQFDAILTLARRRR